MSYMHLIQRLPEEWRLLAVELIEAVEASLREQLAVRRQDFDGLRVAIGDLVEAQKAGEQRLTRVERAVGELTKAQQRTEQRVEQLAEAQQRTEQRVEQLAEAQQRTEQRVEQLAEAQKETQREVRLLVKGLRETRSDLGGLSRSVGYALENEAYRALPTLFKEKYGIEITKRLVRTEIGGEEINLFGRGRRNGQDILLVGETKLRLDERRKKRKGQKELFEQLATKVDVVRTEYPDIEIVPVVVTHYARPRILEQAQAQGIIVVQSFEW